MVFVSREIVRSFCCCCFCHFFVFFSKKIRLLRYLKHEPFAHIQGFCLWLPRNDELCWYRRKRISIFFSFILSLFLFFSFLLGRVCQSSDSICLLSHSLMVLLLFCFSFFRSVFQFIYLDMSWMRNRNSCRKVEIK